MFLTKKQSKEYYETLGHFKDFCSNYNKYEKYYEERCEEITRGLPEGNYTVHYDKDNTSFTFICRDNKVKQYISDEQFGTFNLYVDVDFCSTNNALRDMYKPALLECYYNNGNTYHSDEMKYVVVPLMEKIHEFKENFKYKCKGINNDRNKNNTL